MSIFFKNFGRYTYGTQIDQSHGENRLSHIIKRRIKGVKRLMAANRGDHSGKTLFRKVKRWCPLDRWQIDGVSTASMFK